MLRALRPAFPRIVRLGTPVRSPARPVQRAFSVYAMSHDAQGAGGTQTRMQKTNAKEFYCLTEKDVSLCSAHVHCSFVPLH